MKTLIKIQGIEKEVEIEETSTGVWRSVEYCVWVRNRTGNTRKRQQIRLAKQADGTFAVLRPVYLNRPASIIGWV